MTRHLVDRGRTTIATATGRSTPPADLDADFVGSDLMASGVLPALREAGRTVPDEVAVGGFDDSGLAATLEPPLTTLRQPWERLSTEMVRVLLGVIEGDDPAAVTLPTTLSVRDST